MAGSIATAYVQVMPSMKGVTGNLEKEFGGSGSRSGGLFGSSLVKKALGIFSVAKLGQALGKTISEGSQLQQSLGGVQTLFKDHASKVIENANNAYSTAGLSANAYMEQTTSFAASLLQSLGGDTAKAADAADMALRDMSDNANKFGTDMGRITDAYQGFAKQNYTMLDNLKLGYGGTKTEMQRLLADAQKLTGVKYDIDNLNDVYQAIHAIQESLSITGTTAQEAASTYAGSFAAMKAAAQNVLGNLALGNAVGPSLQALAETTGTFLTGNLLPMVTNIVTALPGAAASLLSILFPGSMTAAATAMMNGLSQGLDTSIPGFLAKALPLATAFSENLRNNAGTLVDAGLNLITNIGQGIINAIPSIVANVPQIVTNICGIINDNAPKVLTAGVKLLIELGKGIISAGPQIIASIPQIIEAIMSVFSAANWLNIGSGIINAISNGAKAASPSNVLKIGQDFLNSLAAKFKTGAPQLITQGFGLIGKLVTGIRNGLPTFLTTFRAVFTNLGAIIQGILPTLISYGSQLLTNLITGFTTMIPNLMTAAGSLLRSFLSAILAAVPTILSAGASLIGSLGSGIISNLPVIINSGISIISNLLTTFAGYLPSLLEQGIAMVGQLAAGLISMIPDVISAAIDIAGNFASEVQAVNWMEVGTNIIRGVASGISSAVGIIAEAARAAASAAYRAATNFLGIHSPSRLFRDKVGKFIPAGMAAGILGNMGVVTHALDAMNATAARDVTAALRLTSFGGNRQSAAGNPGGRTVNITQNIYSRAMSEAELALQMRYKAEEAVLLGV